MSERTYKLQKGDQVVMHTCMEHDHPDNFGKIWTCRSDEFQHKGHDYGSIFLEGFSGSFSTEFLQKVDVSALVDSLQQQVNGLNEESLANFQTAAERGKQLAERDQTIALLTAEMKGLEKFPRETSGTGYHVLDFDYLHMIKLEIDNDDRDFSTLDTDDIEDVLLAVEKLREEERMKALGRE
ncbi:hypothetical protein [Paenibacillus sp. FSL M7-0134]|uniref:hypothetical protein n=1 Tax=Paenibacillus sp. FSL M7-0134 TaxID=2954754 RepID=UPI0030F9D510